MCQTGLPSRSFHGWLGIGLEEAEIVVDRPRDHVEIEALRRARLLEHEERQALGTGVGQPFLDRQAVALRLRDLLPVLVEKKLVVEAGRRLGAERARDARGELHRIDQVLARHLVVDAERKPAHRPVGLPLQLAAPAGHRGFELLARVRVAPADHPRLRVVRDHRRLHDDAGRRVDRQERGIGGGPLLPERGQHDRLDLVEGLERPDQRRVEPARRIGLGRRHELVVEAEAVEKAAQARVVVGGEARILAERVRHLGQRLAEMPRHHLAVRDVVGGLAQAVHVVGERDQARLDRIPGQRAEGVPHHGRARHLAERPDVRQSGGSVSGLEHDLGLRRALEPRDQLPRLLEGPRLGDLGGLPQGLQRHRCPVSLRAVEPAPPVRKPGTLFGEGALSTTFRQRPYDGRCGTDEAAAARVRPTIRLTC